MRSLAVILLAFAAPSTAVAATFTFTVNTASPVTAPGITLTGDDQTKTFTMQYTVAYTSTGNTAGWNVQASSTTLTSSGKTLPAMKVTGVTNAACTGSGCVNPTNSITWPVTSPHSGRCSTLRLTLTSPVGRRPARLRSRRCARPSGSC